MIAALAALAMVQGPTVLELPEPGSRFVCMQAMVPVPALGPRAALATQVLAATMARETKDYTKGTLLAYSLPGGDHVRALLTEDSLSVQITVPEGQVAIAAALLSSVVQRPSLDPAVIQAELIKLAQLPPPREWNTLLRFETLDAGRYRAGDAEEMRQRLFRPDSVVLAASGAFKPGQAREALQARFLGWEEPPMRGPIPEADPPEARGAGEPWLYRFDAPAFPARDVALPARLLATLALGTGKGSSLHRIVREQLGLSYRQEALWLPTPDGFAPVLAFVHAPETGEDADEILARARKELLADVKGWTETYRLRALGMASAIWRSGLPMSPLYVRPGGPVGTSLQDQTFLAGYWPMKTGQSWDPERLIELMNLVRLEELRETAGAMVRDAQARSVNRQ